MEEFSYLDQIIEEKLIDKYVIYRKRQSRCDDEVVEKSIMLSNLEVFNFEGMELEYVMNYLKERDIFVCGNSPALYSDFENYKYTIKQFAPRKSIDISENEQFELLKKYKDSSDKVFRNRLVESYISLVNYIAGKYSDVTGIDIDELSSYGYEGVICAIDRYDLSKNCFTSYAYSLIQSFILNGIAEAQGFHKGNFYSSYVKAKKKVLSEHEYDSMSEYDLLDEIVEEIFKDKRNYRKTQKSSENMLFMSYATSIDDLEVIDDNSLYKEVLEPMYQEQLKNVIHGLLEEIPYKERVILKYYYGIGCSSHTFDEVAKHYNLDARTEAFYINNKGLKILREKKFMLESFNNCGYREYDYDSKGLEMREKVLKK